MAMMPGAEVTRQPMVMAAALGPRVNAAPRAWQAVVVAVVAYVCAGTVVHLLWPGYLARVAVYDDNVGYIRMVAAIGGAPFSEFGRPQTWGYPFLVAMVSTALHVAPAMGLVLVSFPAAVASVAVAARLWGGAVGAAFGIVNAGWIQRAAFGGTEPAFMLALLTAFLCARDERWPAAALLSSLATLVRPVGMLALVAIGVVLVARRAYGASARCVAASAAVGLAYLVLVTVYFESPVVALSRYGETLYGTSPIGVPLAGVVRAMQEFERPSWSVALHGAWIVFALAAVIATVAQPRIRALWTRYPVEWIFAGVYLLFVTSFNTFWLWLEAARYLVPVTPFFLVAFEAWLPRRAWVYGGAAVVCGVGGGIPVVGVRRLMDSLL
jgi:hypothetical protein